MLAYSTNYRVKVRAYKNQYINGRYETVYGNYSGIQSFKTESRSQTTSNSNTAKVTGLKSTVRNTTVTLNWNKVTGAAGYEIDLSIPGIGNIPYYASSNSTSIPGITGKNTQYTARVRAYKYVNGVKKYGSYSDVVRFKGN